MSGLQYLPPIRAIDGATIYPGGLLSVYAADGSTLLETFADVDLSTKLPNPLEADIAGRFTPVYVSPDAMLRVLVTDPIGNTVIDEDDILPLIAPLAIENLQPRNDAGAVLPLATYTFYRVETTQLTTIYGDEALTIELDNPLTADGNGEFPDIWLDTTIPARVLLHDANGVLIFDVEDYRFRTQILPPSAPVLSGEIDGTDFDLSWTASVSQFGTVAGYRLYNADDDTLIVDQVGLTYTDGPLTEGFTYSYYVIGYDTAGNDSERSNIVSISVNVLIEIITSTRMWIRPDNLLSMMAELIAGGGGGAGGASTNGSITGSGGGGGGGGGYSTITLNVGDVGATELVTIGAGGLGGLGRIASTSQSLKSLSGQNGGSSSFGSHVSCTGGQGGQADTLSRSPGGTGGVGNTENGATGGTSWRLNAMEAGDASTSSGAGGGAGGWGTTGATNHAGAIGGNSGAATGGTGGAAAVGSTAVAGAGVAGGAGDPSTVGDAAGAGGGGGGCANTNSSGGPGAATGGEGGDGGSYGAGGGGGGTAGTQPTGLACISGAGGRGADGVVVLRYTYAP